ncbi:glycosyltransferase family 4 protein [Leifsonia sp. NPDC058194]|uniref:glycosyltransferase family 4 protein n=1 Tax=Leifsonia sp. NPDC058194 TaxID=3346374 RepID=UPI0036DD7C9F
MTLPFDGTTVLIGQASLFDIAGSEVVTYELARHFSRNGASVLVVVFGASDEWRARLTELPRVDMMRYDDPELSARIADERPDLAWIHHGVIPEALLRDPGDTRFVFHHMSAYQFQEFPHSPIVEAALASAIVFPAPESRDAHLASGLYEGVEPSLLTVLGNPAPDDFARVAPDGPARLRRILLVSNHPPQELQEALDQLSARGVEVVRFGGSPTDPAPKRLVTPADIHGVDAVVSIGKTVQYSLVAGVPAFVYDHFGGPGWLTPEAFDAARETNFSGRGFSSREAGELADELVEGFDAAADAATALRERYGDEFLLSSAVARIMEAPAVQHQSIDQRELAAAVLRSELMNGLVNAVEARTLSVKDLTTRVGLLEAQKAELEQTLGSRDAEIAHIRSTPGFEAARKVFDTASRAKRRITRS